jgi:hypothetical protein
MVPFGNLTAKPDGEQEEDRDEDIHRTKSTAIPAARKGISIKSVSR